MSDESTVWLHSVGVVIAAKHHNPSVLNKDFLLHNGIVPKDCMVNEAISTPVVSMIKYSNGVNWSIDQDQLSVTSKCDVPFSQNENSQVHNWLHRYVKVLPHTPYSKLSLNCIISIINNEPDQWIIQHLLASKLHTKVQSVRPQFLVKENDKVLIFAFRAGQISRGNKDKIKSVIINCNIHHTGPFDSIKLLQDKILGWPDYKDIISHQLTKFLGDM